LLLLPDEQGELQTVGDTAIGTPPDLAIAKWSYSKGQPAGAGTDTLPAVPYQILPLKSGNHCRGLLVVEPENLRQLMIPEQQRLLETFTVLIANALERMALSHSEAASRLAAEREQLRNALLSALSHDLRTPLTVLFGQAEMLMLDLASEESKYVGQANQIREQTLSTIRLVSNMLDMARIQSGGLNLREEWVALDEVIGGALSSMGPSLKGHEFILDLPEMVLIKGDSAMLERVFTNLIENSLKYAGNAAQHGIRAWRDRDRLEIAVWDSGPGIAPENLTRIFDKFARGDKESAVPGVGLGLAIGKTIIESHRGRIWAENRPEGGAVFRLSLPLPAAPEISEEGLK
jgi:two-component system sensor histidine kinase KdpD